MQTTGVESGITSFKHTVPDLDGEMYLKQGTGTSADVNGDDVVNILDLVLVAQHLGETKPSNSKVDVNGDGVVNILDLILIAQHLGGEWLPHLLWFRGTRCCSDTRMDKTGTT